MRSHTEAHTYSTQHTTHVSAYREVVVSVAVELRPDERVGGAGAGRVGGPRHGGPAAEHGDEAVDEAALEGGRRGEEEAVQGQEEARVQLREGHGRRERQQREHALLVLHAQPRLRQVSA